MINDLSVKEEDVDQIPVVREVGDVFPEEILGTPPSREMEFTIADFKDCTYFKSTLLYGS